MIILGLDPGIGRTGFGVIDTAKQQYLRSGCRTTPANLELADRLLALGQDLERLLAETKPDQAVIEEIFFGTNAKTAIATAQARGTLLYILRKHHIPTFSLTPLQIKSRLVGHGRADKHQVQTIVMSRLNLAAPPRPDDAADALAAALCLADHQVTMPYAQV